MKKIKYALIVSLLAFSFSGDAAFAASQQKSAVKGKGKTQTKTAVKGGGNANVKRETSADVKKQQEATQKEISQTRQQIKINDQSIKQGLSDLGKIEGDISTSKQKIAATASAISHLNEEISSLQTRISSNEKELQKLRDEYLKAVKKMRIAKKQKSDLAFVFASDNFNQAMRRMRYLKQFSQWKDRQTEAISAKTEQLKQQRESLAEARAKQDEALQQQKKDQNLLQQQYARQDAIIADLRKNGEALKSHLAKKQAEANQLKSRISALIAEEQRRAEEQRKARLEAERKAKLEAERKAEAERRAREEAQRKAEREKEAKIAAERKRAVKAAEEEQVRLAKAEREKQRKAEKEKAAKEKAEKDRLANNAPKTPAKEGNKGDNSYADARRRAPRSSEASSSSASAKAPAATDASAFASMKGKLPRPVTGSFRVTSRFGRQSLPELPDVVYDNPGIDAETSAGAAAVAVYQGKVSGVYMIPGYHTVVIVNHGNYYTVYGNISNPSVKVGDNVAAGKGLGTLAPDEDNKNHSLIHFEVWRNREKLNPMEWIR